MTCTATGLIVLLLVQPGQNWQKPSTLHLLVSKKKPRKLRTSGLSLIRKYHTRMVSLSLFVSAHRRILGMASVVCVLVKICVSSISLYKLDTDKLTAPFESTHQFTLVCTVSDSKTVPGCHYNLCSNHSFVLTD